MSSSELWGLPMHDVIIPIVAWAIIASYYACHMYRRFVDNRQALHHMKEGNWYHHNYFYHMRTGWVHKNFLTGQGTANSTRDYLRVLLFMVGNTATIGSLVLGYASTLFDENSPKERMLLIKLVTCGALFFIMFFMFVTATRYAVQFHFLMNTDKDCHGVPMNKNVIISLFHMSHLYYSSGVRLYFCLIPLFAWVFSSWVLMVVCPLHILLMRDYDHNDYLEDELENMYRNTPFGRQNSISDETAVIKPAKSTEIEFKAVL